MKYYDIGLNLFCKQFPDPEKILADAAEAGVCCILTGTDTKENKKINDFIKKHHAFGTAVTVQQGFVQKRERLMYPKDFAHVFWQ